MRKKIRGCALVVAAFAMAMAPMAPAGAVAGAAFTGTNKTVDGDHCFNGPGVVNCNIYDGKPYVWLNGGPNQVGPSALTDGYYFFVVIVPGGESAGSDYSINDGTTTGEAPKNLSDTTDIVDDAGDAYTNRIFHVSGGDIDSYSGTHDQYLSSTQGLKIRLFPYDTTSNPGGEYTVEICRLGGLADQTDWVYPIANDSVCKSDNFKVKAGNVIEFGTISGLKYYDANRNGIWDAGEQGIQNWPIDFTDGVANTLFTDAQGQFTVNLSPDTYTFNEEVANGPWVQTGNTTDQSSGGTVSLAGFVYTVQLANNDVVNGLNFGNVCEVKNRNGYTIGFWSNNNGKAVLQAHDDAWRTLLNGLNLKKANGSAFTVPISPASFTTAFNAYRTWLLNATATNMSYMLSAQLSGTALNVAYKGLNGNSLVQDPANPGTWITINQAMSDAAAFLAAHPNTTAAGALRTLAEKYKNLFDALNNNNATITPVDQSGCPTPTFPV